MLIGFVSHSDTKALDDRVIITEFAGNLKLHDHVHWIQWNKESE